MATTPVLDPIETRSIEQDATLGFQRLEGVRARQRVRRRRRWILVTGLVVALAGSGVLGFTAVRDHHAQAPASRPPADPPRPDAAVAPPPVPISVPAVLAPPPADEVKREVKPSSPSRIDRPRKAAVPAAPGEAGDADGTAAIDWLLKTPRSAGH
jgi:hypothetical protein